MMRVGVERLRRWLLAGASLLVVVIVSFLTYGHHLRHRLLTDLPRKLGADIRQETNSFTWSQTVKGRTVFTLHAAKAIQHKDGKYTLRDVGITVYGKGEGADQAQGPGSRVDKIYGKEFELDQAAGIVRAMGEVNLDLEAPPKAGDAPNAKDAAEPIHVKTSGLVYLQKLGVAATDNEIDFDYNGLTGHATGADYNADTGVLALHSAVKVSGLERGQPVLLTASHADLNRATRRVVMEQAKYVLVSDQSKGGRQTVEAKHATADLRKDGSAERLLGEGGVVVTSEDGSQMAAPRGEVLVSEDNKPQSLKMQGGVRYSSKDDTRQAAGEAAEMRVAFDGHGHAQRVVLTDSVHMTEKLLPANGERELTAKMVELALADVGGKTLLKDAKASGGARLRVVDAAQKASTMRAEVLTAQFLQQGGQSRLSSVHGDGATALEQRDASGTVQTSSGDVLDVSFRKAATSDAKDEIETGVQQGHVVATRVAPAKGGGKPETDKVLAEKAVYDGATQKTTLTGAVEMESPEGTLWSSRVVMEQKSGDAVADGTVKASYRQGGQGEMVHVLADRAELKKANDTAIFYGTGKAARLWQNGSQIEAPVLEFEQKARRLTARGNNGAAMAVRTVMVSAGEAKPSEAAKTSESAKASGDALRKPSVVRIGSREMVYSDESRTAQFTGGVKVESADGVMRGQQATAYLQAATTAKAGAASAGFLGGSVEKVAVSGAIEIDQMGRRAVGDRLVYTTADGVFLLTGTDAQPPKVMDASRGTVTGRELRFREQDASVVISNGDEGGAGQRVHTETRVKRER